jgi:pyruvate/2-oxoglutarate dehydrogenase complex dihydrolipoamide dehydrogenase (E3) component/uncharacterized membrane protein YdjX (TVP38/TMEM64 family)
MNLAAYWKRWALLLVAVLGLWAAYQYGDLSQWLTLEQLKASRDTLASLYATDPAQTALAFFAVYVLAAALSVPGAVILTLAAGAMFGGALGLLLVSFASSLGALLAFWVSRYLLRDLIEQRLGQWLEPINEGLAKDGTFYLLTLRLVPVFPFWLINLLMGLTTLGARKFYVISQIGMLPGTAVYVNAGTQLAAIESASDVLSPALLGSLLLLGLFPLVAKFMVSAMQARKVYARWPRPKRFDRNLVVIGAGAGGLVSAYVAAAVKAKVTLIEAHRMGGDCLNYGCVPSKALIRSAKAIWQVRQARQLGVPNAQGEVDFSAVMQRVHQVIQTIEPHDSIERYTSLGVEVLQGHARITSPWTVAVRLPDGSEQTLSTRNIVIAAGASPLIPEIEGLKEVGFLTSDTLWGLTHLPRRLLVLGGGPIGCELAQSFARLGSAVTQVEMAPRLLVREDPEASELVAASLRADGVNVLTGHLAVRVEINEGQKRLIVRCGELEQAIAFDELLCAVGRSPRVAGYGLEELGMTLTPRNTIQTNAYLQTKYPNIYAVGDVAGPFQFTHTAAHQAWYAVVNALFGRFKRFKADYSVIPWATFTDPEVARVGLSEAEAREQGVPYELTRYGIDDLDRAIADGSAHGFVKVLTVPGKDKILGVTIVGEHAGDLLTEYVLAMKHGLGLNKILATIHTYPTLSEANKYAAGQWKRAHAPQRILSWLERFHAWQRS